MLSNVNIIRSDGNILQAPANQDGVTGWTIYSTEAANTKKLFQLSDVLTLTTLGSRLYYDTSEYFRKSSFPLYIKTVAADPSDFSEVIELKDFANGEIRIMGVGNYRTNFTTSHVTALQTIADQLEDEFAPAQFLYSANSTTSGLSALTNLSSLDCPRVSVMIGADLSGTAEALATTLSKDAIPGFGTFSGMVSKCRVHESIGNPLKNNVTGAEHSEVGFWNGDKLSETSTGLQDTLNSYKYIFFRKFDNGTGVYFNADWTCSDPSETDFSRICYNRVYDKAYRQTRRALIPYTQTTIDYLPSGKMSPEFIGFFESIVERELEYMKSSGEISNYIVSIDPDQLTRNTGTLTIISKIQPHGIADFIDVIQGFTVSI